MSIPDRFHDGFFPEVENVIVSLHCFREAWVASYSAGCIMGARGVFLVAVRLAKKRKGSEAQPKHNTNTHNKTVCLVTVKTMP
jgi:hypothetical protein